MVLRGRPTLTRFPSNILSTPVDSTPLYSIPSVCCPRGRLSLLMLFLGGILLLLSQRSLSACFQCCYESLVRITNGVGSACRSYNTRLKWARWAAFKLFFMTSCVATGVVIETLKGGGWQRWLCLMQIQRLHLIFLYTVEWWVFCIRTNYLFAFVVLSTNTRNTGIFHWKKQFTQKTEN